MDEILMNRSTENEQKIENEPAESENEQVKNDQAESKPADEPVCKGCSASVRLSPEEIKTVWRNAQDQGCKNRVRGGIPEKACALQIVR